MSVIILEKPDELYLQQCVEDLKDDDGVTFGIIIGQNVKPETYIVVHLAKNQEGGTEVTRPKEKPGQNLVSEDTPQVAVNFANINIQFLVSQWLSANRMIPGSFSILGIFVGAKDKKILENTTFTTTSNVLNEIHNLLLQSKSFEISDVGNGYLFLVYSLDEKKAVCKFYQHTNSYTYFTPIDYQVSTETIQWLPFVCYYELNEVFPIPDTAFKINIEDQFYETVKAVRYSIEASDIYFQNEKVNDKTTIDSYMKTSLPNKTVKNKQVQMQLHATIILPIEWKSHVKTNVIQVKRFGGTIRFLGGISSRIYCGSHNTFLDAKDYIRCDIIRSLVARIQVYCESFTKTGIDQEVIMISHPPRRVYFNMSNSTKVSALLFSEYVFDNETTTMAIEEVHQILDLDLKKDGIIDDLEIPSVNETLSVMSENSSLQQTLLNKSDTNSDLTYTMYMLGVVVSLFVLITSVCFNYFLK